MRLLKFYLEIIFPLPLLFFILEYKDFYIFISTVLFYVFVYRQLIDGYRLFELKIIDKFDYKVFNPLYMFKLRLLNFSNLYFSNK